MNHCWSWHQLYKHNAIAGIHKTDCMSEANTKYIGTFISNFREPVQNTHWDGGDPSKLQPKFVSWTP